MSKSDDSVALTLAAIPLALLLFVPLALWYAFTASVLWGWFVVPTFKAPMVSTYEMLGLLTFLGLLRSGKFKKDSEKMGWNEFTIGAIAPAFSLGFGAIVRFWLLGT